MTSVSVWLSKTKPRPFSSARRSSWFSMMPLCTSAMRALRPGSALVAASGAVPEKCRVRVVHHGRAVRGPARVCAMPVPDCTWS